MPLVLTAPTYHSYVWPGVRAVVVVQDVPLALASLSTGLTTGIALAVGVTSFTQT